MVLLDTNHFSELERASAAAQLLRRRMTVYHLFIQTPEANLVSGMKWLQNT
jgi:predicted nucleic acid-binding protein